MEPAEVWLLLLMIVLTVATGVSVTRLIRYRDSYPVKQLSPIVTIVVAVNIWLACCMLAAVQFTYPFVKPNPSTFIFVCNLFYVFFREMAIIGFYVRCMRICLAYYKQVNCRPVIAVFRSELLICLMTACVSAVLPVVMIIEKYALHEQISEFFHFFSE